MNNHNSQNSCEKETSMNKKKKREREKREKKREIRETNLFGEMWREGFQEEKKKKFSIFFFGLT